jgi:capsid protein
LKPPAWLKSLALKVAGTDAPKSYGQFEAGRPTSRRRGTVPGGRPADLRKDLTGAERHEIVKRSRYVDRNSGLSVEQAAIMAMYSVGSGRRPQSLCAEIDYRSELESYWEGITARPTICGRFTMQEVQTLISKAIDRDGEIFAAKMFDRFGNPKVQLLESHNFSNKTDAAKNLYDGIIYDGVGRPLFYLKENPDGDPIPLPASAVMHIYEPDMVSASRAFPRSQHSLLKQQDKMELLAQETHAVKAVQNLAMVIKSNRPGALDDGDFSNDSEDAEIAAGTLSTSELELAEAYGAVVQRINSDEELKAFESNRPNSLFQGFLEMLDREASGGKLPYEVIRDSSSIGGASVRLVVSKAERYIQDRGGVIDTRFNLPFWGFVIGHGITTGALRAVKGWNKVSWTSPRRMTVDAGRESQANRLDVETGLKLWSEEISERGGDFDEFIDSRAAEARAIMRKAGMPDSEPIPLWMLWKPSGVSLSAQVAQETDLT